MVQTVQAVPSLRSVQAHTCVLPRDCGGGLKRGTNGLNGLNDWNVLNDRMVLLP
jgi:hypothetical protein